MKSTVATAPIQQIPIGDTFTNATEELVDDSDLSLDKDGNPLQTYV